MERKWYRLSNEPTGEEYYAIIELALIEASAILLVARNLHLMHRDGLKIMNVMDADLICESESMDWPGTKLHAGTASVKRYALNRHLADILIQSSNSIYGWVEPSLPEDLCFLRGDHDPWYISVTHEKAGFFILSEEERMRLLNKNPRLKIKLA